MRVFELFDNDDDLINEIKQRLDPKCWTGYKKQGTKIKGGVRVNNCVPAESVAESEKRCPQCGMTGCTCKPGTCKCKPVAGWIPNKGFKDAVDEAVNMDRSKNPNYPNDAATKKHRLDTAKALLSDPKTNDDSRREAAAIVARMEKK